MNQSDPFITRLHSIPLHFYRHLVTNLHGAYALAYEQCSNTPPAIQGPFLSHTRFMHACSALFETAVAHGLTPHFLQTKRHSHTYVHVTTPQFTITAHRVDFPSTPPRPADYRENRALDNQYFLDPQFRPQTHGRPYAHLLHGPSDMNPAQLGFVQLAFPAPNKRAYMGITNLYMAKEFARTVDFYNRDTIQPERIAQEVSPRLRPRRTSKVQSE